jgi:hypothetical protein
MHGKTGGVRQDETGLQQLAKLVSICQFFPLKSSGNKPSLPGCFRIIFG